MVDLWFTTFVLLALFVLVFIVLGTVGCVLSRRDVNVPIE